MAKKKAIAQGMRTAAAVCCAVLLCFTRSWAQSEADNWGRCEGSDPDRSIAACTALIQSAGQDAENLAVAYNNRGIAYDHKGRPEQAIADYSHALRLKPDYAGAFNNRACLLYTSRVGLVAKSYSAPVPTLEP